MVQIATQTSILDHLMSHKDKIIAEWGEWRDAQTLNDAHKQLVDDTYSQYIRTLDTLIECMLPF